MYKLTKCFLVFLFIILFISVSLFIVIIYEEVFIKSKFCEEHGYIGQPLGKCYRVVDDVIVESRKVVCIRPFECYFKEET